MPADGAGVTMTGHAPTGVLVSAIPTVVVQDDTGLRSTLDAAPVPLDGSSHPLRWSVPPEAGGQIVAFRLSLEDDGSYAGDNSGSAVSMSLRIPGSGGATSDTPGDWRARALGSDGVVLGSSISTRQTAGATVLTTQAQVQVSYLRYEAGEVLATSFDAPSSVPVVVSQALADAVGTKVGGELSATVSTSALTLDVVDIVASVPSAPGQVAVLADVDTVSRALISSGHLGSVVDAFWVSRSRRGGARARSADWSWAT